jgi:hypothetical protein
VKEHSVGPFATFHLRVGTRLALRKLAPILAVFFGAYYVLRPELFNTIFAALLEKGSLLMGFVSTLLSLGVAAMAAPRICLGLNGWIRHLPARGLTHRRLAGIAVAVAQIPLLLVLAILSLIAFAVFQVSPILYLLGLPILGLATGLCVLPVQRNLLTKTLSFASCVLSTSGHWIFLTIAIVLLIVADRTAGSLSPSRKVSIFHKLSQSPKLFPSPKLAPSHRSRLSQKSFTAQKSFITKKTLTGSFISAIIVFRAFRLRILFAYLPSLFILGLTSLFLSNNTLTPHQMFRGVIFGGTLSIAVFCAFAANLLAVRRPPWPWARSLPWSAHHRILTDTLLIGLLTIPLLILIPLTKTQAIWPVVVSLSPLAAFSALMVRTAFIYQMGAVGRTFIFGTVVAVLVCLIPAISFIFLASTPFFLRYAAAEERNQKVSRWLEMHHLAAGDSLSWSRQ